MAKKTEKTETAAIGTTETETKKVRKTRTPRVLSDIEREAKQYYEDIKSLAKLLPLIDELGHTGRVRLMEYLSKADVPFKESDTAGQ